MTHTKEQIKKAVIEALEAKATKQNIWYGEESTFKTNYLQAVHYSSVADLVAETLSKSDGVSDTTWIYKEGK